MFSNIADSHLNLLPCVAEALHKPWVFVRHLHKLDVPGRGGGERGGEKGENEGGVGGVGGSNGKEKGSGNELFEKKSQEEEEGGGGGLGG